MSDDLVKQLRNMNGGWASDEALAAADRIEELEVKLAKALDFIQDLTGCEWPYDEDAKRILAELSKERSDEKGEADE